jgi:hypothetical protein
MANITLNTNGSISGTDSLNPVPASFGPVLGGLNLIVLLPTPNNTNQINSSYYLLGVPALMITWENNKLVCLGNARGSTQPFNFTQYVNAGPQEGILNNLEGLGIPNIAFPDYLLGKTLVTLILTEIGNFQIITSQ